MAENVLLASQGIYDLKGSLFGTELLFRNEKGHTAMDVGEDIATSEVLLNHCSSVTDEIAHINRPAFINVSAEFFLSDAFLPVDPQYVYIELVERIQVCDKFIRAAKSWKKRGFRFALDDFEFDKEWDPLLDLADVVKVDVLNQDPEHIRKKIERLKDFECLLLAERVETQEEFDIYKEQGFKLFQGYFLSRPKVIRGKNIRPEQSSAIAILDVTTGDSGFEEIAHTVERDPMLSVQLLKIVNSPLYNLERPIESIKEAVVFLGMEQLRKWAIVLSLVSASENSLDAFRVVLNRAKFCELLAIELGRVEPNRAFMLGLLSGIDVLLGIMPKDFVEMINLSEDMSSAIIEHEGRLGKIIKLALNIERQITTYPERLVHSKQTVLDHYHDAFYWAEEVIAEFS